MATQDASVSDEQSRFESPTSPQSFGVASADEQPRFESASRNQSFGAFEFSPLLVHDVGDVAPFALPGSFRRGGSDSAELIEGETDPAGLPEKSVIFAKESGGTTQLFSRDSAGVAHRLTASRLELVNGLWFQNGVTSGQAGTDQDRGVSSFQQWKAPRAGSVVGLSSRISGTITTGTIFVAVSVNGSVTAFLTSLSSGDDESRALEEANAIPFAKGDLIGVSVASSPDLLPSGSIDVETRIEIQTS